MTKEMEFFIFLIEQYAFYRKTTADVVMCELEMLNLTEFVYEMYEIYHIEDLTNAFEDIDKRINLAKICYYDGILEMSELEKELCRRLLEEGEVVFRFEKRNGDIRDARGTLNFRYIPPKKFLQTHLPITTFVRYYDLDKEDWRAFSIGSVLDVI